MAVHERIKSGGLEPCINKHRSNVSYPDVIHNDMLARVSRATSKEKIRTGRTLEMSHVRSSVPCRTPVESDLPLLIDSLLFMS